MRKLFVLMFFVLCAGSVLAQSVASKKSKSYSAVDQFSPHQNPNGAWSYGYTVTLGSPLTLYTIQGTTCCSNQIGWFGPFGPAPGYPLVTDNEFVPSQSLDMDPGPEGEYSIVRWTAPQNGTWDIVGDFFGTGVTTTDVHILRDGVSIYDNFVNASDVHNFGLTLKLTAGDTIDFAVGFGGAFGGDPTGLQAVISPHRYDFATIDFPGAVETQLLGLNNRGDVVGAYSDTQGNSHGFSYNKKDGFRTIDVPGASLTLASSINDSGRIVGIGIDALGIDHGFLLSGGDFTAINVPGGVHTDALGINEQGDIVGVYDTGDVTIQIGFVLRKGHFTSIQDPSAAPLHTQLNDINDRGQIVGLYIDTAGIFHGLLLDDGNFATIDFPDAVGGTLASGINSQGQIAGRYLSGPGGNQGFVLRKGDYEPVVFPGSRATAVHGINESGQLVGFYRAVGGGPRHGFIAKLGGGAER
jgi:uncharacterized membrane protein